MLLIRVRMDNLAPMEYFFVKPAWSFDQGHNFLGTQNVRLKGLVHTCRPNRKLASIDKVLRLFVDKLGTNRLFGTYPLTEVASLWSPIADGKLEICSATFHSVKLD